MRSTRAKAISLNIAVLAIALPVVLVAYQNCAPKNFSTESNSPSGPVASGAFDLRDQTVQTAFNTPKSWTASWSGKKDGYTYSFEIGSNVSTKNISGVGVVELTDAGAWALLYTPEFGFRGESSFKVYARKNTGEVDEAKLTLQVGNTLKTLAPALAVRASGCITCHAEVHSSLITDFGYGGDGGSRNYYFGQMTADDLSWNDGLPYGDHYAFYQNYDGSISQGSWWSLNLAKTVGGEGQKVYVPAASLPAAPAGKTGATTLRGYVQHRLTNSYYPDSASGVAIEKSNVYIGAPTASRLESVFAWNAADETKKYKYLADASGVALSGLSVTAAGPANGKYFTNTGVVTCEGDLLLKGTVYFNNLQVQTRTGCRIHATGSVFIYGSITYPTGSGDYSKRNLQITSAKSILMGLGSLFNGSTHCENGDMDAAYYAYWSKRDEWTAGMTPAEKAAYEAAVVDSAKYRLEYFWGLSGFFFRSDSRNGRVIQQEIYSEMLATIGAQKDAACRPEGRAQAFERLLLNAPLVESRYAGGFKGSIVAEIAYMGLGLAANESRFKFEFDPVFQNVDVFPLLQEQDFLRVQ